MWDSSGSDPGFRIKRRGAESTPRNYLPVGIIRLRLNTQPFFYTCAIRRIGPGKVRKLTFLYVTPARPSVCRPCRSRVAWKRAAPGSRRRPVSRCMPGWPPRPTSGKSSSGCADTLPYKDVGYLVSVWATTGLTLPFQVFHF